MTELLAQDKFRDGVRRIDLVLVAVDDGDIPLTETRNIYLQNILKTGLEIETSPGVVSDGIKNLFCGYHYQDTEHTYKLQIYLFH